MLHSKYYDYTKCHSPRYLDSKNVIVKVLLFEEYHIQITWIVRIPQCNVFELYECHIQVHTWIVRISQSKYLDCKNVTVKVLGL